MNVKQQRIDDVKAYLSTYTNDAKRLDALLDKRIELCEKAVYQSPKLDIAGKQKKNGMLDRFAETLASIDNIERQILNTVVAMEKHYEQVDKMIESLGYEYDARIVLEYRYINGWKWEDIANQLNFALSYVYRLHNKALEKISTSQNRF